MATRADAIASAREHLHSGAFLAELGRRVGYRTESQNPGSGEALRAYLVEDLQPAFAELGFATRMIESPTRQGAVSAGGLSRGCRRCRPSSPMAMATSSTAWKANGATISIPGRPRPRAIASMAAAPPTTRASTASTWRPCAPCARPAAASSASTPNSSSRPARRSARRICAQVCEALREELKADLFLASDGPRLSADRPTIFLGCRGGNRIHLDVNLREGGNHSGNWGGVLANPATILANAIASLVDGKGRMKLEVLKPPRISNTVRAALADVKIEPTADEPALVAGLGRGGPDAGRTAVMPGIRWKCWRCHPAISTSRPTPFRARASAVLQLRFVVGTKYEEVVDAVRAYLHANGFPMVEVSGAQRFARLAHRCRQPLGELGGGLRSGRPPARRRRSCRISAARCPTTCLPKGSACRRSGCRIPIPAARSMRRTNTSCCR